MKEKLSPLLVLALAHLAAAISPGPSFLYVARKSASVSRQAGLKAALAMGLGAAVWAAMAMVGLAELFERVHWLYLVSQLAGALHWL